MKTYHRWMKTLHSRLENLGGAIHGFFAKDDVGHIKLSKHDNATNILHKNHFCNYILDFEEEEEDLFHDMSQEVNNSVIEKLSAD